jgi:small nuclear ribonucleoprotein (snRNP)-like protein
MRIKKRVVTIRKRWEILLKEGETLIGLLRTEDLIFEEF